MIRKKKGKGLTIENTVVKGAIFYSEGKMDVNKNPDSDNNSKNQLEDIANEAEKQNPTEKNKFMDYTKKILTSKETTVVACTALGGFLLHKYYQNIPPGQEAIDGSTFLFGYLNGWITNQVINLKDYLTNKIENPLEYFLNSLGHGFFGIFSSLAPGVTSAIGGLIGEAAFGYNGLIAGSSTGAFIGTYIINHGHEALLDDINDDSGSNYTPPIYYDSSFIDGGDKDTGLSPDTPFPQINEYIEEADWFKYSIKTPEEDVISKLWNELDNKKE